MAGKTAQIYTRIEPDLKKSALRILNDLGISTTDAIRMYFQQIVDSNGIPFKSSLPNAKTRQAMNDAREGKDLTSHDSPEEYFKANSI